MESELKSSISKSSESESGFGKKKLTPQNPTCKRGQGICSIRFSNNGTYLGVTLPEPCLAKAYFQLRNWQDMKMLKVAEFPFYEGYCNHYILILPSDEFLVYKYSEKEIFLFDSNGQHKQMIRYAKGICSFLLSVGLVISSRI
jgi:hypothetical protein